MTRVEDGRRRGQHSPVGDVHRAARISEAPFVALRPNPGRLPFSWKVLLSGYAAECAYEKGRLDMSLPLEELRRRSRINDGALAADRVPDFSGRIREGLPGSARPVAPGS